jgi:DNA-binding MarR family transcriptional regulator
MSFAQPASVDDLLNYRLSRLLSSSGALVTRLCEGQYGITRREWRLICVVADHGAMSPSRLAELSHLERPRVSRHVADLVTKKILARVVDPSDRRRAWLEVTARGRALHAELFPQSVRLNNLVLSSLNASELAAFDRSLTKLTAAADEFAKSNSQHVKADRRHGGSRRGLIDPAYEAPKVFGVTMGRK